LHEEGDTVVSLRNGCWHLSLREWVRGFHNLVAERLPSGCILLGYKVICVASPVVQLFVVLLFICLFIYVFLLHMMSVATCANSSEICLKYLYWHLSFLFCVEGNMASQHSRTGDIEIVAKYLSQKCYINAYISQCVWFLL
jgi:hypothetical protein